MIDYDEKITFYGPDGPYQKNRYNFRPGQEVFILWGDSIEIGKVIGLDHFDRGQHVWCVDYRVNSQLSIPESMLRPVTSESLFALKKELRKKIIEHQTKVVVLQAMLDDLSVNTQKLIEYEE